MSSAHYTYPQATGNRIISGMGTFPNTQIIDIPLPSAPIWIVATDTAWVVITQDGKTYQVNLNGEITQLGENYPPNMPLAVLSDTTIAPIPADISPYTHPVYTETHTVYITPEGDVVLNDELGELIVKHRRYALPDARPVLRDDGQMVAIYGDRTDQRYVHAIMGDALEAAELMVMDMQTGTIQTLITLTGESVFEGMSPIWADVDGDGAQDLITTVSDSIGGAQLRVYRADGSFLASSPAIGRGGRWRHQLAFGSFSADGVPVLAEVRTPHIGGILTFWRYNGDDQLVKVDELTGYTSHVIHSRNLDMAIAGDFDGDGIPEMVLPTQDRTSLGGMNINDTDTITIRWTSPLDGALISNLSALNTENGLALIAGIQKADSTFAVRMWVSQTN